MWWALIEEIAPRAEEMAVEKEMACCVRGYHVYKEYGQQQLVKCWCVVADVSTSELEIFGVKLYSRKIFLYVLCTKIFRKKANYGIWYVV